MAITIDTSSFEKVLKEVLVHTSRDTVVVLNNTAKNVVLKAAELTKKADPLVIEKALTTGLITTSKSGKVLKHARPRPSKMVYLILNAKQRALGKPGLSNAQMSMAAQAFVKSRKMASGYTAYAAWNAALKAFGGRGFGHSDQPGFANSRAHYGYGSPATVGNLLALMVNTAPAIEKIGVTPLAQALQAQEREMIAHLESKLADRLQTASR